MTGHGLWACSLPLQRLKYAIIDIETTGGNARTGKITEIAVFLHNGQKIIDQYETLLNPGIPIPPFISKLTGITDEMVLDAPTFEEVAKELDTFTANAVFVAHNAHFDYGFVREEFRRVGIEFKRKKLCTVQLSRHSFPGLASYSLDKITKELKIVLNGHHRASADAEATALLFDQIIKAKSEVGLFDAHFGIPTLEGINSPYIDEAFLLSIPDEVGVFRFYNEADELIYSKRSGTVLSSICEKLKPNASELSKKLLSSIHRIDYQLTGSPMLAQLLEIEDVIKEKPIYNHGKFSLKIHFAAVVKLIDDVPHLVLEKRGNHSEAALVFTNFFEARHHLEVLAQRWNTPLSIISQGRRSAPALAIPEKVSESGNISSLNDTLIFVDEGRYVKEHCRIFIEKGAVLGYGYYDEDYQFSPQPLDDVQATLSALPEQEYAVRKFMEKGRFERVIKL